MVDWTRKVIDSPELFSGRSRAYEQCVVAGPLVFIAGQVGWAATEGLVSPEFEPQVRQTFANIRAALEAAGSTLGDLVSMTVYLTDPRYMDSFLTLRKEILGETFATSTMICVNKLYEPEMLVEISAIAVRPV